jgi:hypothetical protein
MLANHNIDHVIEIGWISVAAMSLVIVFYLILKNISVKRGGVETKISMEDMVSMRNTISSMDTKIDQINTAVNHKHDHEPTLVERVRRIESEQRKNSAVLRWMSQSQEMMADHVGLQLPECIGCKEAPEEWEFVQGDHT